MSYTILALYYNNFTSLLVEKCVRTKKNLKVISEDVTILLT